MSRRPYQSIPTLVSRKMPQGEIREEHGDMISQPEITVDTFLLLAITISFLHSLKVLIVELCPEMKENPKQFRIVSNVGVPPHD